MSMFPRQTLCHKCGKFHTVVCESGPFGRETLRAEHDAAVVEATALRAELAALRVERDRLKLGLEELREGTKNALAVSLASWVNDVATRALAAPVMPAGAGKKEIFGLAVHGADAFPQEEKKP